MLLPALLALQVAAAADSTYSSEALRRLVTEASRINAWVPATLGRYHATLESEISYGARAGDREMAVSLEQIASTLNWTRDGSFEQHVVGYRSQSIGPQMATLGFFRSAWAVPSLYGNRLALLFGVDTSRTRVTPARRRSSTPYVAVHPLAVDRERYYTFTGGDTILNLRVDDREIRIARVDVLPRSDVPDGTYFSGEVDLDVERRHVVRMRGSFLSTRRPAGTRRLGALLQLDAIAYVELVNAEVNGEFWLPSFQRFEGHAMASTVTTSTAVFRIASRFRDYQITPPDAESGGADPRGPGAAVHATDTLRARPHLLTRAGTDSLAQFGDWRDDLGVVSAPLAAADFDSVAPPRWRPFGRPVVTVQTERLSDFARFNRVEGLFTGTGVAVRMRDMAPGLTLRGTAGYAWSEGTVRGRVSAEQTRGAWTHAIRAGRALEVTNDFRNAFDSTSSLGPIFGFDNYDYVDRYWAAAGSSRRIARGSWLVRVQSGWARDARATIHMKRSPLGGPDYFANRGVDEGDYLRTALTLKWNPNVAAEFMKTGVGASLEYVRGDGDLRFDRVELQLDARTNVGRWTFASRLDGGAVMGSRIPPQQLFEIGAEQALPGYEYKEFAGNQAAVLRGIAMFRLNVLTSPIHLFGRIWLPEPSPALSVSVQAGWTGASSQAARDAMLRLGPRFQSDPNSLALLAPASTLTGSARATVAAGVRFFGGSLGFVVARPVDRVAPWKFEVAVGQLF